MKKFFFLFTTSLLLSFFACKKDYFEPDKPQSSSFMEAYDNFGPKLEHTISLCVKDIEFSIELVKATQQRLDGDFEFLLKDFVALKLPTNQMIKDFILETSNGTIVVEELDNFLEKYPSTIIAVRGNPISWLKESYVPPVKFLESTFNESSPSCVATLDGEAYELDLLKKFEDAVIAIRKSERHDLEGNLIILDERIASRSNPSVDASEITDDNLYNPNCDPEPTNCSLVPMVTVFTATPENLGIKLSYTISNFSEGLCSWGRVYIERLNPDNSSTTFVRFASDPTIFFDHSGIPGATYTYKIYAKIVYIKSDGSPNLLTSCPESNSMVATATAPLVTFPLITSYLGTTNPDNGSIINYHWYPPEGVAIQKYRIRKLIDDNYQTVWETSNIYENFYSYSTNTHGEYIETQIQYQALDGNWHGAFFDKSYSAFRVSGEPLKYYGLKMNLSSYEYSNGENLLNGAPEIRLLALQATSESETSTPAVRAETILFTEACGEDQVIYVPIYDRLEDQIIFTSIHVFISNGYYRTRDFPTGYPILNNWSSDLFGTVIRLTTKETDSPEVHLTTSSQTTTVTVGMSASIGTKELGIFGVSTEFKSTEVYNYTYPESDLPIENKLIYYHDPRILNVSNQLVGIMPSSYESNLCTALEVYIP